MVRRKKSSKVTNLQIILKAKDLKDSSGMFTTKIPDPFAAVVLLPSEVGEDQVVLGKTEILRNNLNPEWTKHFDVEYKIHKPMKINVAVYDKNKSKDDKLMGNSVFDIGEVLGAKGSIKAKEMKNGGILYCRIQPVKVSWNRVLSLQVLAKNITNKGGKLSYFYEISRRVEIGSESSWEVVHRSRVNKGDTNPCWDVSPVNINKLDSGDDHSMFIFTVYQWSKKGENVVVGELYTSRRKVVEAQADGTTLQLVKKGKFAGEIQVLDATVKSKDKHSAADDDAAHHVKQGKKSHSSRSVDNSPSRRTSSPAPASTPDGAIASRARTPPPRAITSIEDGSSIRNVARAPPSLSLSPIRSSHRYAPPPTRSVTPPPTKSYVTPITENDRSVSPSQKPARSSSPFPRSHSPTSTPNNASLLCPESLPNIEKEDIPSDLPKMEKEVVPQKPILNDSLTIQSLSFDKVDFTPTGITSHKFSSATMYQPSFAEYVSGGLHLNLCVAIDFTGSNGNPRTPGSLHYRHKDGSLNDYQTAIKKIANVVAKYDWDQKFPVWGFGAKIDGKINHCFQVGPKPEAQGVQGILDHYKAMFKTRFEMSGPTDCTQVITKAANEARAAAAEAEKSNYQAYTILLIVTDGSMTDLKATKDAICAVHDVPLSIIIVGIGDADFEAMQFMDDLPTLYEIRDITQFVEFNAHRKSVYSLTKATLEELPDQVVDYFMDRGIYPGEQLEIDVTPDQYDPNDDTTSSFVY